MLEIYEIWFHLVPNTTTGQMHPQIKYVGEDVMIIDSVHKVEKILEEIDKQDRPVVNVYFDGGIVWSYPDKGIIKKYKDPNATPKKDNKSKSGRGR